jgi:hypothetical protein
MGIPKEEITNIFVLKLLQAYLNFYVMGKSRMLIIP